MKKRIYKGCEWNSPIFRQIMAEKTGQLWITFHNRHAN